MTLWRSWHLRCDLIHGNGRESISNSRDFLLNYMSSLHSCPLDENLAKGKAPLLFLPPTDLSSLNSVQHQANASPTATWRPLARGTVCINVDASFSEADGAATAGVIMRDHSGSACLAASHQLTRCSDSEEAEAKAILLSLQIARDSSFVPSSVRSDCARAVSLANCPSRKNNRAWSIYEDINQLKATFDSCSITYTSRSLNTAAHDLAQFAHSLGSSNTWLPPLPPVISSLIVRDHVTAISMNI